MAFSLIRFGLRANLMLDKSISSAFCAAFSSASPVNFVGGHLEAKGSLPLLQRKQQFFENALCKQQVAVARRSYAKEAMGQPEAGYKTDSDSDSDSETEHRYQERGNSEFWRRKMRTFHGLMDLNKDGIVSFDDFQILAERFIDLGHLSPSHQREFRLMLKEVWEEQWGIVHPYNTVTAEQYLENMHHVLNDKDLRRKAHRCLPYLFKAVDKDQSGSISVDEFKLFFECLDIDTEHAIHTFMAIDRDRDGVLNLKEFVKTGREFFLTEDERKPSKLFWGPLMTP